MRRILAFSSIAAISAAAVAQGAADLLCRANIDGRPALVAMLRLDYTKKTVNGSPAEFGPAEIRWTTVEVSSFNKRAMFIVHELNRVAGTYRNYERDSVSLGPAPLYSCEKSPAPKF